MKITISIEVNGKNHGLKIEIDEDQIKQEHRDDPDLKVIRESIINTINKIRDHLVKEITLHKEDDEIEVEL